MLRIFGNSLLNTRPRGFRLSHITGLTGTIRGRVFLAFVAISFITGVLGFYTSAVIARAGRLVAMTYDRSLMSINYARAASGDFSALEGASARRWTASDPSAQAELDKTIVTIENLLGDDLAIAAERAQSTRAAEAAEAAGRAVAAWSKERRRLPVNVGPEDGWQQLTPLAQKVSQQFDLPTNSIFQHHRISFL